MKKFLLIPIILFLFIWGGMLSPERISAEAKETSSSLAEVPAGYIGIYSINDLDSIRNNLSGKYILMNELDLSAATNKGGPFYRDGAGWEPIGSEQTPFTGELDGNGYKISGLKISVKSDHPIYAGLFGYTNNAKLKNLILVNVSIHADNTSYESNASNAYAGGIAGYAYNSEFSNVSISGKVEAKSLFNGYAGGVVGYINARLNQHSGIANSENAAKVNAKTSAGGIAGEASRTSMTDAVNNGNIESTKYGGGIVGNMKSDSTVSNSQNNGMVTAVSGGGGIAGYTSSSVISHSFNEGNIISNSTSADLGGIAGSTASSMIQDSYNKGNVINNASSSRSGGIAGRATGTSSVVGVYNLGEIKGTLLAGGIAGDSINSVISQAYNDGEVSTASYTGGIIGWSSQATIMDSFNTGKISAVYSSGGIVGIGKTTTLQNCFNIGYVSVPRTSSYGGIAGEFDGDIKNTIYPNWMRAVGRGIDPGIAGKSFEEMLSAVTYEGFDFQSIWSINNQGFMFPQLSKVPFLGEEEIIRIVLSSKPDKTTYLQGEELELGDSTITVYTSFGNKYDVKVTEDMVSGYDKNNPGTKSVNITYKGFTTSFTVNVLRAYDVIFEDYDGTILKKDRVAQGGGATPPQNPSREGYTFTGWDSSLDNIRSNKTITALYDAISFTVTYMDGDQVLQTDQYSYGTNFGSHYFVPEKKGYTFARWYKDKSLKEEFPMWMELYSDLILYGKFYRNPEIPQNVTVTKSGYDKLKVTWTPVKGAEEYEVSMSTKKNGPYNYSAIVDGSSKSYVFDTLNTGTTYYFKVRASYQKDETTVYGEYSPVVSGAPVLDNVTSVKVEGKSFNQLRITWKAVAGATGYEIYRSTSTNGKYGLLQTISNSSKPSFTNNGLATGTKYYYKVRAYRLVNGKKVYGAFSSVANGQPVLSKVSTIKVSSNSYDKLRINWSKVNGATGFEVYRSTAKNGKYNRTGTISKGSTLSFINNKVATGTPYYYKVRAYRLVGGKKIYGPFSSVASGKAILNAPSRLKATRISATSSKLSWSSSAGASGYEVFRATSKKGKYSKAGTVKGGKTISFTNKKLKKRTTYYYKMRAYRLVNGKKVYSNYTTVIKYKS
ncbi:LPXTG-motif cell wall anchor domain-containing protein [Bacillus freudenreichii]|nr:LPXTG-motif cell wall anchor domain-containing protein [Bacillus freudenreichii]